jgi:hypothetical protein
MFFFPRLWASEREQAEKLGCKDVHLVGMEDCSRGRFRIKRRGGVEVVIR